MADPHRAGLRYTVTPLNYEGRIEIRSGLQGDHRNAGVERYNSPETATSLTGDRRVLQMG